MFVGVEVGDSALGSEKNWGLEGGSVEGRERRTIGIVRMGEVLCSSSPKDALGLGRSRWPRKVDKPFAGRDLDEGFEEKSLLNEMMALR